MYWSELLIRKKRESYHIISKEYRKWKGDKPLLKRSAPSVLIVVAIR
jgi:hypothetical protein